MYLEIEFEEQDQSFDLEFEQVTEISDGGYERGYAQGYETGKGDGLTEGYAKGETDGYGKGYEQGNTDGYTTGKTEGVTEGFADALAKRTELVVTDSGEYVPEGESTGFKKVTVGIQKGEDLDAVVAEQAELIEELSATLDEKIGAYDVGYDAALEKLTDLVVTENGEYTPSEGSTGFKIVSVSVQSENKLPQVTDGSAKELTAVDFQGATNVRRYAFYYGTFESVELPDSIVSIGEYAFSNCSNLTEVTLPKGLTSLMAYCFASTKLPNIVFPETVTSIAGYAFNSCKQLRTFTVKATTPPTLSGLLGNGLSGFRNIIVPVGCGEAYRQATNWSTYADFIVEEAM